MKNTIIKLEVYNNIFTNPLILYLVTIIFTWLFYILTSDVSYRFEHNYYLLSSLVSVSILIFTTSYLVIAYKYRFNIKPFLQLNIQDKKIYKVSIILGVIIIFILVLNLIVDGLPPIFSLFSSDIKDYAEYGRFKAFLTPALNILVLITLIQKNKFKKILIVAFAIIVQIMYISRGHLIELILQIIFLYICLNRNDQIKYILYKILPLPFIIITTMGILGDVRTGSDIFYNFMGIKEEYKYINIGILWCVTYIDVCVSDLLTIIKNIDIIPKQYGLYLITNSLPSFARPEIILNDVVPVNLIDGTATYLGNILIDFGLIGIVVINVIYGSLLSTLYYNRKYKKNILIKPLYLSILALIWFFDYIFFVPSIIQFILSIYIYKYISFDKNPMNQEI